MSSSKSVGPVARVRQSALRAFLWLMLFALSVLAFKGSPWKQLIIFVCWAGFFYYAVFRHFIAFMLPARARQKSDEKVAVSPTKTSELKAQHAAAPEAQPAVVTKRKYAKSAVVVSI